ncbi:MAG: helix-turn-helix domain protein [Thermoleophilia bacterium]|nr:helix-turn-helix domain protein [Thermoleophilia bacterium]
MPDSTTGATPLEDVLAEMAAEDESFAADLKEVQPVVNLVKAITGIRKARGVTQKQLADQVGTTQSAIARLESGDQDPRWSTVHNVLTALGAQIRFHPADSELLVLTQAEFDDILSGAVNTAVGQMIDQMRQQAIAEAMVKVSAAKRASQNSETASNAYLVRA